jgi:hypothetical protein
MEMGSEFKSPPPPPPFSNHDQGNEKAEGRRGSEKHTHKSNHDYKSSKNSDPPLTSPSSPSTTDVNYKNKLFICNNP